MAASIKSEGHRSQRALLRNATFIEPQTGIRSNRSFTLHSPPDLEEQNSHHESSGEATPLLHIPGQSNPTISRFQRVWQAIITRVKMFGNFVVSDTGRAVFKCALAYLLSSMCTFIPALSDLFGRSDSKHTIATVAVYFHPARSQGSMFEALILALTAFLYAATVSVTSMAVSVLFTDYLHQVVIGHFIVLVVFVGGGLGMIGWIKLKKGDPLVNTTCSLASLSLIAILTAEGAVQAGELSFRTIVQYLKMTVAGVIISAVVSFSVFPVYGRRKFKKNMVQVTDTLSDMLGLITSGFLSGDDTELEDDDYSKISEKHRKSAATLNQNLKEAKFELNVMGLEKEAQTQTKMVQCVQLIAQSIGGLRSAAAMQFVIIQEPSRSDLIPHTETFASYTSLNGSPTRSSFLERRMTFGANVDSLVKAMPGTSDSIRSSSTHHLGWSKLRSPGQIFELFIDELGPSMKALAFTMKEILDELPYDPEANFAVENNPKLKSSLEQALELYKGARKTALQQVYNKKDLERDKPLEVAADWEEAAACCGQFSFSLLEVAEQIKEYLIILDDLEAQIENQSRSWSWLKFWKRRPTDYSVQEGDLTQPETISNENNLQIKTPTAKPAASDRNWVHDTRPKFKQRIFRALHNVLSVLRREDKKFAVKVGFGAMLYALPSYIAVTRPIYVHWRGEWGLLSYMLVCSMTIGASNTTGYQRFLGTCLGALLAVVAWEISNDNPVILALFGFCMAYWTAHIIVGKGKGPMGRFIMLAYNLTALFAYSLSMNDGDNDADEEDDLANPEIWTIAMHRCIAVLSGCIWGIIITRAVWPISARNKLKAGISLLWLRMGLIWKRDPLSVFIDDESRPYYMDLQEEIELQRFLNQLQSLIEISKQEFSLRSRFPADIYHRILKSTSRMLEAFHTMNIVILKDLHASEGETDLLHATVKERAQLCIRISHQFSVLASSMKLEYSMATDALPNLEHTRDRLLARIFAYRKEDAENSKTTDEDYSLIYTYALVTGQLGMEIQDCLKEIEGLFGILDEESLWLQ